MALVLLILSFLQLTVLPSALFHEIFFAKTPLRYRLINSIPISFILNYITAVSLYSVGMFNRLSVLTIVALQLVALTYFIWKNRSSRHLLIEAKAFYEEFHGNSYMLKVCNFFGLILIGLFIYNIGTTFTLWDAVFSWNRWAMDWFSGGWPVGTAHYPQMYPVNWAVSYFIQGADLQFVPKLIMSTTSIILFGSSIVFYKNFKTQQRALVFAVLSTAVIYSFLKIYINDGYVDGPVSVWTFIAFMNLISSFNQKENEKYFFVIACLLTAFLPLVKQAGWIFYVPFLYYLVKYGRYKKWNLGSAVSLILFFVFTFGFYVYTQYDISKGANHSEVPFVTGGIYNGQFIAERFFKAIQLLFQGVGLGPVLLLAVMLFFPALFKKTVDKVIYAYWILYFFIWTCFYSYDQRNLMVSVPFILFFAFNNYVHIIENSPKIQKVLKSTLSLLVLVTIAGSILKIDEEKLRLIHDKKTLKVEDPVANEILYKYYSDKDKKPYLKTVGDYPMVVNLRWARPYFEHENMNTLSMAKKYFFNPEYKFIILYDLASPEVRQYFKAHEIRNEIKKIWETKRMTFYEKIEP